MEVRGRVDEQVERPQSVHGFLHRAAALLRLAEVRVDRERPPAQRADRFDGLLRLRPGGEIMNGDVRARVRQRQADGPPDADRGPGHERKLAGKGVWGTARSPAEG